MQCIADIAGLDFKQVCHAGVGKAWESIIYRMIQYGECQRPTMVGLEKRKYSGALVLEPEPKSYTTPIEIFDVKGLYPTVMMLHNLSFETVCANVVKTTHRPEFHNLLWIPLTIVLGARQNYKHFMKKRSEKQDTGYA